MRKHVEHVHYGKGIGLEVYSASQQRESRGVLTLDKSQPKRYLN